MSPCQHCGRPVGDQSVLCTTCGQQLREHLADLPGLDIDAAAAKLGKRGTSGARGKGSAQPLIVDLKAADLAARIRTELVGWVRILAHDSIGPADTIPSMASWLANRTQALRHTDGAQDAMVLVDLIRKVRRLVDAHPERRWLGVCNAESDTGQLCCESLFAEEGAADATCPACGARHDVTERTTWLRDALADFLMTAGEIGSLWWAFAPDWTEKRLVRLIQAGNRDGRLMGKGQRDGSNLYMPAEVVGLVASTAPRRRTA